MLYVMTSFDENALTATTTDHVTVSNCEISFMHTFISHEKKKKKKKKKILNHSTEGCRSVYDNLKISQK